MTKKPLLLVLLLLPLAALVPRALGAQMVVRPGFDHSGGDYTSFPVRDEIECRRACEREVRCQAFTLLRSSRTCYLKDAVYPLRRNGDAVTGSKGGAPIPPRPPITGGVTEEWNTDRPGYDYTNFGAGSSRECRDACARDGRCLAYTFLQRFSRCYLKSGVPSPRQLRDAVSGVKEGIRPGRPESSRRVGWDHVGGDYRTFGTYGVEGCQSACQSDRRCRAWTYLRSSRACYLKNAIYDPQPNGDAVTGIKRY